MANEPKEDSFAALFESQASQPRRARALHVGDKIEAVVVRVGKESVFVELDDKQQAFIDTAELRSPEGEIGVKEGDTLSARVVELDLEQGLVRLGKSLGKPGSLAAIEQARAAQIAVEGKVTGVNKGGLEVDLGGGTRAFCPISQADARFLEDPKALIGQSMRFLVTDVREGGKNIVVSRRALLQREACEAAEVSASALVVGATVRGTVTSVRDFGAFVDLGGIDGLIPRSEVTHDRSVQVADALKPGDLVEVSVLEVKDIAPSKPGASTRRVTLSLKALADDPWATLDLAEGRVVRGTVTRSTDFGRFVRVAPSIEGLLHVSELSKNAAATIEEGQQVLVVVKSVDRIGEGSPHRHRRDRPRSRRAGRGLRGLRPARGDEGARGERARPDRRARRAARNRSPQGLPGGQGRDGQGARDRRRPAAPVHQGGAGRRGARRLRAGKE